jgi:hypothetical protein
VTAGAPRDPHGEAFWDARYASRERIWTGEPNRQLFAEAASLPPARIPAPTRTAGRSRSTTP